MLVVDTRVSCSKIKYPFRPKKIPHIDHLNLTDYHTYLRNLRTQKVRNKNVLLHETARGIPTAAYQVLHMLSYPGGGGGGWVSTFAGGGYLPWRGVPTLAGGYLSCLRGYLPWSGGIHLGRGVLTLAGMGYPFVLRDRHL